MDELRAYQAEGCKLCLNGHPTVPYQVVKACFREDGRYMRDLISDDRQCIRKINFIRVKES